MLFISLFIDSIIIYTQKFLFTQYDFNAPGIQVFLAGSSFKSFFSFLTFQFRRLLSLDCLPDSTGSCSYWKRLGYCSSGSYYYQYMLLHCQTSCGFCVSKQRRDLLLPRTGQLYKNKFQCTVLLFIRTSQRDTSNLTFGTFTFAQKQMLLQTEVMYNSFDVTVLPTQEQFDAFE